MLYFSWKPIVSFAVSLIRPTLDIMIYFKTQFETQEIGWFYYVAVISRKIDVFIKGKIEEPCWEMRRVYDVAQNKSVKPPVYIQKTPVGFLVWSIPTFLNDIFTRDKMTPCFISIRYIGVGGVEFDLDVGPEYYVSGNELLSAGFVEWWIKTRYGTYWTNYSPESPYKIVLMDTQLNVLELGPFDAVVLNKKGFHDGKRYKKFRYTLLNIPEYEE